MVLDITYVIENNNPGKKSKCRCDWCGTKQSAQLALVPDCILPQDGVFLCKRCFMFAEDGPSALMKLPKVQKDMNKLVIKFQILLATQPLTALEFDYWSVTHGNRMEYGPKKALQWCIEHKIMAWFEKQPDGQIDLDLPIIGDSIVDFDRLQLLAAGSAPTMLMMIPSTAEQDSSSLDQTLMCNAAVGATKTMIFGKRKNNSNKEDLLFSAPTSNLEDISNFMIDTVMELVKNEAVTKAKVYDHLNEFVVTGRTFDVDKEEAVNLDE